MQSGGKDKRIKLSLQDDVDLGEDATFEDSRGDDDQKDFAILRAKHEDLRRQIALLNARLAETQGTARSYDAGVSPFKQFQAPVVAISAICVTLLVAWSLRKAIA